jgi:drug/metabolite transporter (DMT)-like permease
MARGAAASLARTRGEASTAMVWAALGTVYMVWGSTYLAIRVAIDTIPPFLMAGVRFLVAGAVLYAVAIGRGEREADRPGPREWRAAAVAGILLLVCGNGAVVWAEQHVDTGPTSLIIATVPLWMVLIAGLVLREGVSGREILGIILGLAGLVVLVGVPGEGGLHAAGAALLLVASLSWASGSMYSRRAPLPRRPLVSTAMQMLVGGAGLAVLGGLTGELAELELSRVTLASALGLVYLIVFGSLVAFSAYVWLLQNARTSLVSTYAYVNPVVAVFLGWAILDEPITAATVMAGAVIVAAVALIVTGRGRVARPEAEAGRWIPRLAVWGPARGRRPHAGHEVPSRRSAWWVVVILLSPIAVIVATQWLGPWALAAGLAALAVAALVAGVDTRDQSGSEWNGS